MSIRIGEGRSMFCERTARVRTAAATRIGATHPSLLQELITGALPAMDPYIRDENQVDNMYGASPYPLILADDVHLGGANHVPKYGKVPQQDVVGIGGNSGDCHGNAISSNQGLMENDQSENMQMMIDMPESQTYATEGATYVTGQWTSEEDSLLKERVEMLGEKKWSLIANGLPGRIGKQCRERWFNHVQPDIKKTPWTKEEELMLVGWHRSLGRKWSVIAKHIPGRSENNIKNHWNATFRSLKAKRRSKTIQAALENGDRPAVLEEYMRDELNLMNEEGGAPANKAAEPPVPYAKKIQVARLKKGNRSGSAVLEEYMRGELDLNLNLNLNEDIEEGGAPANKAADPPAPYAGPVGWQQADELAATAAGSNSSDQCWLEAMLCNGMMPPPMMQGDPDAAPAEDDGHVVYATYDADANGHSRNVHVELPYPYQFVGQQVYPAAPGGYYYPYHHQEEAGPSHRSNGGAGGDGDAGFGFAASEQAGMPFGANAPAAQNQGGGGI